MAEKWNWLFICNKEESPIFTARKKGSSGKIKGGLILVLVAISSTILGAQTFSRQQIMFSLFDKTGKQLTGAAINSGQIKVYSLREAKAVTHSHLSFDKASKYFTFSESAISPGMALAFVSATDTMYISFYGRSPDRTIDGIKVQKGSYVLSSNEFGGRKLLKVESWDKFLEDETPPQQQDLTAYKASLKDKKPITLVAH